MEELRFDGRVAIVTGAGRGLGRDHALLLAGRGAAAVVNDLGAEIDGSGRARGPADDVVAEIVAAGGRAVASYDSVADEAGAQAIIATALDAFGRIDVVINNAGMQIVKRLSETTRDDLLTHLNVHLVGSFLVSRAAWPHLAASDAARIVNTTSTASLGITGYTSYSSAKAGLIGLTRTLALEGHLAGIAVNAIAPSAATRLAFAKDASSDIPASVRETMARTSPPSLVSPVVAYLAHASCALNGEVLFAGGGRVTRIVMAETPGFHAAEITPEVVAANIGQVLDDQELMTLPGAMERASAWAARMAPAG